MSGKGNVAWGVAVIRVIKCGGPDRRTTVQTQNELVKDK